MRVVNVHSTLDVELTVYIILNLNININIVYYLKGKFSTEKKLNVLWKTQCWEGMLRRMRSFSKLGTKNGKSLGR